MIDVRPTVLEGSGIRLEPMTDDHHDALARAAADGRLWELWFTAVPAPDGMRAYVAERYRGSATGTCFPGSSATWRAAPSSARRAITTSFPASIAWKSATRWYAESRQRTHVNTTCKLLLLAHAFDTLGCKVVGLRTDNFNFRSQRAIEALGAKKDGVHPAPRAHGATAAFVTR